MANKKNNEIISVGTFSNVLELIDDLTKKNEFILSFPEQGVNVQFSKYSFDEGIKKFAIKSSKKKVNEAIKEIVEIIYIILSERKTSFISSKIGKDKNIEKKVNLVQSRLINKKIREKYLLHKIYKTNVLENFDWEINKKIYDKNEKTLKDFPICLLRFQIVHDLGKTEQKFETYIFECTEYEVDELINEFKKIKESLKKIKSGVDKNE